VKFVAVTVKCDAVCSNTKTRVYQVTLIAEDSILQIINSLSNFMRQILSDNVLDNISDMRMLKGTLCLIIESRIFAVNNSMSTINVKLLLVGRHPVKFGDPCSVVCYTT